MSDATRRAFTLFHAVLGGSLLYLSHNTLFEAMHAYGFGHLTFAAAIQFVGAILFLIPRTMWWGGVALLVVLIPSFLIETTHGDWALPMLIEAVGVWLVMVHGPGWGRKG